MYEEAHPRRANARQITSVALFSDIVVLFSTFTAGVAGPGWVQKTHKKVEGKEEEEKEKEENLVQLSSKECNFRLKSVTLISM